MMRDRDIGLLNYPDPPREKAPDCYVICRCEEGEICDDGERYNVSLECLDCSKSERMTG